MQRVSGFAQQGGATVITVGVSSTTLVEQSFPGCTISVFNTGTAVNRRWRDFAATRQSNDRAFNQVRQSSFNRSRSL